MQQARGGDKDSTRLKLIELAEKELERDSLAKKKDKNLPEISKN